MTLKKKVRSELALVALALGTSAIAVNGVVTTSVGGIDMVAGGAIDASGRIISVGRSDSSAALTRHLDTGALDTSFSGDGKLTYSFGGIKSDFLAVRTDASNRIIVGGGMESSKHLLSFGIARFSASGAAEMKATLTFNSKGHSYLKDIDVYPDGRIIAVGNASGLGPVAARFLSTGKVDSSFSGDGKESYNFTPGLNVEDLNAVAISGDKVIMAGRAQAADGWDFLVARLNSNGSVDTSFGSGGSVLWSHTSDDALYDIAIQSDGKIVVSGRANGNAVVARFNTDGSFDSGFGSGGVATNFAGDDGVGLAIQGDGKILVSCGVVSQALSATRLNADGTVDATFGSGGTGEVTGGGYLRIRDLGLQADGKVVIFGDIDQADFALGRLNSDGTPDTGF
jgi:uncharacterized delta-60 repeat protein